MCNVAKHLLPLWDIGEMLGEDVSAHMLGRTMEHDDVTVSHCFVQERKVNPVSPGHVLHGGVFATRESTDGRRIILHELHLHWHSFQLFP